MFWLWQLLMMSEKSQDCPDGTKEAYSGQCRGSAGGLQFYFSVLSETPGSGGAFSSAGNSPVLTQYLKESLKEILTEELGQINDYMGSIRPVVKTRIETEKLRRQVYQTILARLLAEKNFTVTGRTGTDSYTGKAYERVKEKRNKGMDRTRRLRQTAVMRSMVRENHVRTEELIYPLFVMEGENIVQPVESMPGICQYSVDRMNEELDRVKALQIPANLIFGIPEHKDEVGERGL